MLHRDWKGALAGVAALSVVAVGQAGAACVGDCDGNGQVAVNELIVGTGIALERRPVGDCALFDDNEDRRVRVAELVRGVGAALQGCGAADRSAAAVVRHYGRMMFAAYGDATAGAEALRAAVDDFLAAPSAAALTAAKQAWLAGRPAYLQTEVSRFYDGPIDNEESGPEGRINAWPLDEAYIDYVDGAPGAGIINDPIGVPVIDAESISSLNEEGGETNISTGWHAIEFLLWGQDFAAAGPGMRPFTDYLTSGGTAGNQARRRDYLAAAARLLVADLTSVRDQWAPGEANYRAALEAVDGDEALRRMLTGMGTLSGGELTGERMAVPFETRDQEDEHSCFSDNTHVDHRNDELGIQNVYLGRYGTLYGPGIYDLVRAVNATLADQTAAQMQSAVDAIFAIPIPFDNAIQGGDDDPGRVAIGNAIDQLNLQTDRIADVAAALGISISTTIP